MSATHRLISWVKLLRPQQYVKNIFVFTPMIFARRWDVWEETTMGFIAFCLTASAVYALNDAVDAPADRLHPHKRKRPVASGAIPVSMAYFTSVALSVLGISGAFWLSLTFGLVLLLYLANNLLYTFWLKRLALWDVFSISGGFLLRIYGGAAIGAISVSAYLFMTVFFLSLFLALGKRRHELLLLAPEDAEKSRKSLRGYSVYYLDQLMVISATLTLVVYVLYLMHGHFSWLMGTLPVVVMGIFRYYHLTHHQNAGEPSRDLLSDLQLLGLGVVYGILALLEMLG